MSEQLGLFGNLASYYDQLYSFKDYEKESEEIITLIDVYKKNKANTLLDLGCGTGKHLNSFKKHFQCTGVDLSQDMLKIAKNNLPDVEFFQANMIDMDLCKKFDLITCLFSSIGYVKTDEDLAKTWRTLARHTKTDGIVVVEPWFSPEHYHVGLPFMTTYQSDDLKITRMNISKKENNLAILEFHYLIAKQSEDVQYFQDRHEMRLIEPERMLMFMKNAEFKADFLIEKPFQERGVFVGIKL